MENKYGLKIGDKIISIRQCGGRREIPPKSTGKIKKISRNGNLHVCFDEFPGVHFAGTLDSPWVEVNDFIYSIIEINRPTRHAPITRNTF